MGIFYESQVHCTCEECGRIWMSSIMTIKQAKTLLRKEGWSLGKYVFCPECNSRKGRKSDE